MEFRYEKNICNKTQCFLSEIVPGSVAFACFYLSVSISSVFQFLLVVINLASILVTVYLTREMRIKEFEDDDLVSPRTNQIMFIGLTGFMSIICLYRGITAGESYQQIIAYIGAILCLIIILFLIWGLKYYKK
ncbi:immunity protein BlpL [Streptococcus pneumoniae]|nr:immunity protein BlpL [Streptococcus pneumoniae]